MYFPYSVKVVRNGSIVLGRLSLSRFQGVRQNSPPPLKTVKYAKQHPLIIYGLNCLDQYSDFFANNFSFYGFFMFLELCGVVNFGLNTQCAMYQKTVQKVTFGNF